MFNLTIRLHEGELPTSEFTSQLFLEYNGEFYPSHGWFESPRKVIYSWVSELLSFKYMNNATFCFFENSTHIELTKKDNGLVELEITGVPNGVKFEARFDDLVQELHEKVELFEAELARNDLLHLSKAFTMFRYSLEGIRGDANELMQHHVNCRDDVFC